MNNNIQTVLELAETKYELELLIDNVLSNLTPSETRIVLKEGIKKKIGLGLAGIGLYGVGRSDGKFQGKRQGRTEGIRTGYDIGSGFEYDLNQKLKDHNKLSNKAKRTIKKILGKPVEKLNYNQQADIRWGDDPTKIYRIGQQYKEN